MFPISQSFNISASRIVMTVIAVTLVYVHSEAARAEGAGGQGTLQITLEAEAPYYAPHLAQASPGTVVFWWNGTASIHSVRHDGCELGDDTCLFDSGTLEPGEGFRLLSVPRGIYPYHCQLHPIMRGVLVVTDDESHERASTPSSGQMVSSLESPEFFVDRREKDGDGAAPFAGR
jgi:plastocyanin